MGTLEKNLRTAAVNRLAAAGVAGGRVYSARQLPIDDESLTFPLVCVSTIGTSAQKHRQPHGHKGTVDLVVACFARSLDASDEGAEASFGPESDLEDALDTLEAAVQSALLAHPHAWLPTGCRGVASIDSKTDANAARGSALVRARHLRIRVDAELLFEHDISDAVDLERVDVDYHYDGGTTLPDLSDQIEVTQ